MALVEKRDIMLNIFRSGDGFGEERMDIRLMSGNHSASLLGQLQKNI